MEPGEPQQPIPECPICYVPYDNIFQTPLLLPCSHTFCLECLSRLCVFLKQSQALQCPLCRASVSIPHGGVPNLLPNMAVITQFPPWMQTLQEVWLDGYKLCCIQKPLPSGQVSASEEDPEMLITVELLPNPAPRDTHLADLIHVHRPLPLSMCRQLCHALWEYRIRVFWVTVLLGVLTVLLMSLIYK
ncbi:PREDICTED: RING finger protein 223-like [Crocodylus porosus]|uniref:RING finger protein 223-like n=1 Tax=Crocodylus porosus TaxID=8502 RepID=UPI0009389599|nr:PREDICTED: RING finger protein 223-like [Crocodylus porosus]